MTRRRPARSTPVSAGTWCGACSSAAPTTTSQHRTAASCPEPVQFDTGGREVELTGSRGEHEVLRLEDAARDALVPWAAGWLSTRTVVGASEVAAEWHRLVRSLRRLPALRDHRSI